MFLLKRHERNGTNSPNSCSLSLCRTQHFYVQSQANPPQSVWQHLLLIETWKVSYPNKIIPCIYPLHPDRHKCHRNVSFLFAKRRSYTRQELHSEYESRMQGLRVLPNVPRAKCRGSTEIQPRTLVVLYAR